MASEKSGQSVAGRRTLSGVLVVLLLASGCASTRPAKPETGCAGRFPVAVP